MQALVSLVEDHFSERRHLVRLLRSLGFEVLSEHADAEDALRSMPLPRIDLALVDIVLPRASGIDLVRELKSRRPDLPILMLTAYDDGDRVFEALAAGADGYLLKTISPPLLQTKIQEALDGGGALSATVARNIILHFRRSAAHRTQFRDLTDRELAVLREVARGHTYKEVGARLRITAETVRVHVRNIKEKLQVSTRGQAVARFLGH